MIEESLFDSRDQLFQVVSAVCVAILEDALRVRDKVSLMVSGGSTPAPVYAELAQARLPWQRVTIALVDERWVDIGHPMSNEQFIKTTLLQDAAAEAVFIGMKNQAANAQAGVTQVNRAYDKLPKPFDLLILGVGTDGHTASLFPGATGLARALDASNRDLCCPISARRSAVTGDFTERMTLTLHGILQARQIILLITGREKLEVYRQALSNPSHNHMPVSAVLQQQETPLKVYWAE